MKFVPKNDIDDVIYSEEYTAFQTNTHSIAINNFRENQQSALQSVEYELKEIEQSKPYLNRDDYTMLKGIFENGKYVLDAICLLGEAAYASNIMLSNFDQVNNPEALYKKSIKNLEDFIQADKLIPEMNNNLLKILNNYKDL